MTHGLAAKKKNGGFDLSTFLATIGEGRKILSVPKKKMIFAQGDGADAVFYVQKGKVRLTVVSKIGKEATIAIVSEGNCFGEGSLAGQLLRMGSAVAMTDCEILRVEKKAMPDVLHREAASPKDSWPICWRAISATKRFGGPIVQLQRKKTGPGPSIARSFWQGRHS